MHVGVGFDSGGGNAKAVLVTTDKDHLKKEQDGKKKQMLRSTGVCKCQILGVFMDMPETPGNAKMMWDLMDLDTLLHFIKAGFVFAHFTGNRGLKNYNSRMVSIGNN